MARKVADVMWEMLAEAGVKRCYGIVGDALNPVIDALRRNGKIEFIHVRHEEYGVFAAVAEAYLTRQSRGGMRNRRSGRDAPFQRTDGRAQGGRRRSSPSPAMSRRSSWTPPRSKS